MEQEKANRGMRKEAVQGTDGGREVAHRLCGPKPGLGGGEAREPVRRRLDGQAGGGREMR